MRDFADEALLKQAVADRALIDITAMAHAANFNHTTYITPGLWNGNELAKSEALLRATLEDSWLMRRFAEDQKFGSHPVGIGPDMKKRGWPKAACPSGNIFINLVLLPSESSGVLVVLADGYEHFDLQTVRSYAM